MSVCPQIALVGRCYIYWTLEDCFYVAYLSYILIPLPTIPYPNMSSHLNTYFI